jgi:hypothetical protein
MHLCSCLLPIHAVVKASCRLCVRDRSTGCCVLDVPQPDISIDITPAIGCQLPHSLNVGMCPGCWTFCTYGSTAAAAACSRKWLAKRHPLASLVGHHALLQLCALQ